MRGASLSHCQPGHKLRGLPNQMPLMACPPLHLTTPSMLAARSMANQPPATIHHGMLVVRCTANQPALTATHTTLAVRSMALQVHRMASLCRLSQRLMVHRALKVTQTRHSLCQHQHQYQHQHRHQPASQQVTLACQMLSTSLCRR